MPDSPLTKQGVRDLDVKQRNGRKRDDRQAVCFHEWEHSKECLCHLAYPDKYACLFVCRRCGLVKV